MRAGAGYTLYGSLGSGSASVELALAWTGAPFRQVEAAPWEPGPGLEALRRINPLAQIPTLVLPDGSVMSESAAILVHLGLMHPDSGLLPADASARAQVIRGLVYVTANCYAAIGVIDYPERWLPQPDDDAARERLRLGARARVAALWEAFADGFDARPWLNGAQPGALDLLAAVVSKWSGARAHLKAHRPAFHELLLRIEKHPRAAPVFERHWPPASRPPSSMA